MIVGRNLALIALALAGVALAACGPYPGEDPSELASERDAVCPPDEPDCDRLDEPCVIEEEEELQQQEDVGGPTSSPLGLADPKTSSGKYRVWPQGRVPYKISSTVGSTTKTRLLAAMNEWQTKSSERVRFVKATSSDTAFVQVTQGSPRVSPHVGYRSDIPSTMYLRNPEYITVIRHELGHVLGFHHEHKRSDRGSYIQVLTGNIVNTSTCQYQFSKCSDCELIKSYHVKSVMHYRTYRDLSSCRVNGKPVLLHKDGSAIDHDWLITSADLSALAVLYPTVPGSGGSGGGGGSSGSAGSSESGGATSSGGAASDGGLAGSAGGDNLAGSGGTNDGIEGSEDGVAGASGSSGSSDTGGTIVISDGNETSGAQSQRTRIERIDAGCGCRAAPSDSTRGGWLLTWTLAAVLLRRARRSRPGRVRRRRRSAMPR